MRCPLCLGRFLLRTLPCGHFLCSYCILSARLRHCIPADVTAGIPQCAHCQQSIGFRRHRSPTTAFAQQNAKIGGINAKQRASSPTFYFATFCRPAGGSAGRTGRNNGERDQQQHRIATTTFGMRSLRRGGRIFPTMEKRTNSGGAIKCVGPAWEDSSEQSATIETAHRRSCAARKCCPTSAATAEKPLHKMPMPRQYKNSWSDDDRREYDKSRAYFRSLVDRFDSSMLILIAADQQRSSINNGKGSDADRQSADLLLRAKELLCQSEQRIWRGRISDQPKSDRMSADRLNQHRFGAGISGRSADREFDIVRRLRELVFAMEVKFSMAFYRVPLPFLHRLAEYNRREGCAGNLQDPAQCANVWCRKVEQARIQMLALSVLLANFGDYERDLALLRRRMSLLGLRLNERGAASEQKAAQLLDALLVCSGEISAILERRPAVSYPSQLISAMAHVQFRLFDAMDEISRQLLDLQIEKRLKVWQMISRCFGQLLQMESLSWRSNEFPWKRFAQIAQLAKFLQRFADVCDTSTQMLCIIEVEKARAFVAEEETEINCELRGSMVREKLSRIETDLAECQRVQKWNELKLGTQIVRRMDGTKMLGGGPQMAAAAVGGGGRRKKNAAKMREWLQKVISGGRKIRNKMMGGSGGRINA